MNIKALISRNNFNEHENESLIFICKELENRNYILNFEYDNNLECAKFRPSEKKILLKPNDSYSTIIYELLHAKLTYIDNYPDFEAINQIQGNRNLILFKQIISVTNDLQHFIFYDKFKLLTQSSIKVCFIQNEKDFMDLSNYEFIDFFKDNPITPRERSLALDNSYKNNFIPLLYNILLYDGDITQLEKIKDNIQIRPFYKLFDNIINADRNTMKIEDAYENFFEELYQLINNN